MGFLNSFVFFCLNAGHFLKLVKVLSSFACVFCASCVELSGTLYSCENRLHTHKQTHCMEFSCCLWSEVVFNIIAKVRNMTSWLGPSCAAASHTSLSYSSLKTHSGLLYNRSAGPSCFQVFPFFLNRTAAFFFFFCASKWKYGDELQDCFEPLLNNIVAHMHSEIVCMLSDHLNESPGERHHSKGNIFTYLVHIYQMSKRRKSV